MAHTQRTDDPDSMLQEAAAMARSLIPNAQARIADLKDQLAKAEDQLLRLEQIERIASGNAQTELQIGAVTMRTRRYRVDDAPTEDDKDAKTTQDDIDNVLLRAERPLTVAEIRDIIEAQLSRKRATSTLYNYLGKGKVAGLYKNDDDGWSLTDKGREALTLHE